MGFDKKRRKSRRGKQILRGMRRGIRLEALENRIVFSGASPVAVNDLYEAIADETMEVSSGVLVNDTDAEGDPEQPRRAPRQVSSDGCPGSHSG